MTDRDVVLDKWLRDHSLLPPKLQAKANQLSEMALVGGSSAGGPPVPDPVLEAWYQLIARQRYVVDQSELAFIKQARRQGWNWPTIAEVLNLPDAEAAEQRSDELTAIRLRTGPDSPGWRARDASTPSELDQP